jgi:hypothetical protein
MKDKPWASLDLDFFVSVRPDRRADFHCPLRFLAP